MIKILGILLIVACSLSNQLQAETAAQQQTLQQLIDAGHLSIDYQISPAADIILYQPVTINVEVATDRWFAAGSSIHEFQMDDAVVYRSSQNSINSSRKLAGTNWAVQNWSLVFYPQKPGKLMIPALSLTVSVNTEGGQIVEGEQILSERQITVELPASMREIEPWVATTGLTAEEEYQGLKNQYRAGDAITRTITLQINDAPAMMLPTLKAEIIEGLGLYIVPPKISDKSNRGELLGELQQQFIYTIERPGSYSLPAYHIDWWDLNQQQPQAETLPALGFSTTGQAVKLQGENSISNFAPVWKIALSLLVFLTLMLTAWQLLRRVKLEVQNNPDRLQKKAIIKAFWQAHHKQDWSQLLQCLYRLLASDPKAGQNVTLEAAYAHNKSCQQIVQRLNQAAFCDNKEILSLSKVEAKLLIETLLPNGKIIWPWQQSVNLSLNQ